MFVPLFFVWQNSIKKRYFTRAHFISSRSRASPSNVRRITCFGCGISFNAKRRTVLGFGLLAGALSETAKLTNWSPYDSELVTHCLFANVQSSALCSMHVCRRSFSIFARNRQLGSMLISSTVESVRGLPGHARGSKQATLWAEACVQFLTYGFRTFAAAIVNKGRISGRSHPCNTMPMSPNRKHAHSDYSDNKGPFIVHHAKPGRTKSWWVKSNVRAEIKVFRFKYISLQKKLFPLFSVLFAFLTGQFVWYHRLLLHWSLW